MRLSCPRLPPPPRLLPPSLGAQLSPGVPLPERWDGDPRPAPQGAESGRQPSSLRPGPWEAGPEGWEVGVGPEGVCVCWGRGEPETPA